MAEEFENRPKAVVPFGHAMDPFTPLEDMVLIRRDPPKGKVGPIHLVNEKPSWWGTVEKVGLGRRVGLAKTSRLDKARGETDCKMCAARGERLPMMVAVGDRVCVIHGCGHSLDEADPDLLLVSQGQLLVGPERKTRDLVSNKYLENMAKASDKSPGWAMLGTDASAIAEELLAYRNAFPSYRREAEDAA